MPPLVTVVTVAWSLLPGFGSDWDAATLTLIARLIALLPAVSASRPRGERRFRPGPPVPPVVQQPCSLA